MNAKVTATIAVAVVALMVFAAAGATTYSWFSDTEETDVTINTAKVDIDGEYVIKSITVGNNVTDIVSEDVDDTTLTLSEWNGKGYGNKISIENDKIVVDKAIPSKIEVSYTVSNGSSINAYWRMYTALPKDISIVGKTPVDGITYVAGSATSSYEKEDGTNYLAPGYGATISFVLDLTDIKETADDASVPVTYAFEFVSEAYQYGYVYSEPVILVPGTVSNVISAKIGDVKDTNQNVKVQGTTNIGEGESKVDVPIIMEFDNSTNSVISGKDIAIEAKTSTSDDTISIGDDSTKLVLDITLGGTTSEVDLNGYVTITVTIPGSVPEAKVYYNNGSNAEPVEVLNVVPTADETVVTFRTNHFSEYVVTDSEFVASVGSNYYTSIFTAIESASSEDKVLLLKNMSFNKPLKIEGKSIDGNGHSLYFNNTGIVVSGSANRGLDLYDGASVENVTLNGETIDGFGFRAIFLNGEKDISLNNVELYGTYTLNTGSMSGGLIVSNSVLCGWTSYSLKGATATFTDCSFKYNVDTNQGTLRPYDTTELTNCTFEDNFVILEDMLNGVITYDGKVKVSTADELIEALDKKQSVLLTNDIKIDPASMSSGYGKTGIKVNGQSIDGNGYTIDIKGAGGTWDSGINISHGKLSNLHVTGSFRGIFVTSAPDNEKTIELDNVTTTDVVYTIHVDSSNGQGIIAKNCHFYGWTSFANSIGNVSFIDCVFGEGSGYAFSRPYAPTIFERCEFETGFEMDARAKVIFKDCTLGGVTLTAENISTLVTGNVANASVDNKL